MLDPEAADPVRAGLLVEDGRIVAQIPEGQSDPSDAACVDLSGRFVAPGFLDLHYHGSLPLLDAAGYDASINASSASLSRSGTTAFLATTVAQPNPELTRNLTQLASLVGGETRWPGAIPIGIHLEGPWINEQAAGAQPKRGIRDYRPDEAAELLSVAEGLVRLVTFAPELDGAAALQHVLESRSVSMAMGHSIATSQQARLATDRGATHVTHLWNAMGPVHHREPGLVGFALSDDRLTCDLICDGLHVDPEIVKLTARAKRDRLVLITDRIEIPNTESSTRSPNVASSASSVRSDDASSDASSPASESASSRATMGGEPIYDDGSALRLRDGRLAGSSLSLETAMRNSRRFAELSLLEAVAACTVRPARVIGVESERGTLRPGARADLVELDESGQVLGTWIAGVSQPR